jgi:type VI secretion system protein ImpA
MTFDPEAFLLPVDPTQPSGPNLEYDGDFQAMERARRGKPEQQMGSKTIAAEAADWPQVTELAQSLLARSRDLRVAVPLSEALLRTEGFPGLAAGLALIRGLLERQWDTVHPQLDSDDDNDPTSRVNSLLDLVSADGLLKVMRESTVVRSKTLGRFNLRDIQIASGKLKLTTVPAAEPASQAQIDAAFRDSDLGELQTTLTAVSGALASASAANTLLAEKVGVRAPEFRPLLQDLSELQKLLTEKTAALGGASSGGGSVAAPGGAAPGSGATGDIRTRQDVARAIDRLVEYYRREEPSSPIPLLLLRAKRLVAKDFLEIIRDLTPSGVSEAESIGGVEKSND